MANYISKLSVGYIIIEPIIAVNDFVTCWITPYATLYNNNYFSSTIYDLSPFPSTSLTIWINIVGIDVSLSNTQIDLYTVVIVSTTTSI